MESFEQILRLELPNLFRLYLNPYVTQTCFCLTRYVQITWGAKAEDAAEYQTFLANSFDEALSGAIKLARYSASLASRPATGLVLDAANRLGPYASALVAGGGKVEFLPGLVVVGNSADPRTAVTSEGPFGLLVLVPGPDAVIDQHAEAIRLLVLRDAPVVITCVDREALTALRRGSHRVLREFAPDIVVFDESFVDHAVPFSALTARKATLRSLEPAR